MANPLKFFILDADRTSVRLHTRYLAPLAASVTGTTSPVVALTQIVAQRSDCLLMDMTMPGLDGVALLQQLRREPSLAALRIIAMSGRTCDADRRRALELGADGYLTKPVDPDHFGTEVLRIVQDRILLAFWGVRGTLPVPGSATVRYGGNTNCVSLMLARGTFLVFDAGTGIKVLSDHLLENGIPQDIHVFISHPHWDHINGLPFFAPLYMEGNDIRISGPAHGAVGMRQLIAGQMDGVYFPINIQEFAARICFRDLGEETLNINKVQIRTMLLNHPGVCLGYRIDYRGRSVCYLTDNEIFPADMVQHNPAYFDKLIAFVQEADALITDCTYTDAEYMNKVGWGHSAVSRVVAWAHKAGVKTLYLYHHDPYQNDQVIDDQLALAQSQLATLRSSTRCIAPAETQRFVL